MPNRRSDVVAIIQPFVPSYRRPLFDAISAELESHGLRLEVWHDFPKGRVAARGNADSGVWSVPIKQHRVSVAGRNVTYRSVGRDARQVRAVVAGLASTNVETYGLALDPRVRLMLWGHGKNFTASNNALDGKVEGWLSRKSTHIFTYTDEGKDHVVGQGVPAEMVTVVVNTTDTKTLRDARAATRDDAVQEIRERYDLRNSRVALFVGAFDEPKQLPFLFEAMDLVAAEDPDVVLVLAGAGPEEDLVRQLASTRSYARVIGRLEAPQLAEFASVVDLMVMPGRIGLVAVDALALGIPIATTRYPYHAPESAYLTEGEDSVWTEFEVAAYANEVKDLLADPARLEALSDAARKKGDDFSVEASARRFVAGILKGLGS